MRQRALAALFLAVVITSEAGCGGAQRPEDVQEAEMAVETVAGLRFVTIPRSTPGLVHLALFVDAGSRDASPPQVATVAAWAAATPELSTDVFPDGTLFEISCELDDVNRCMTALASALRTRGEGLDLGAQEAHLASVRRVRTADERSADLLALGALIGGDARSFAPLGVAADDEAVTAAAVTSFYSAHYGPVRSMLVAAGDVSGSAIKDAVRRAFGGAGPAEERRAERGLRAAAGVTTEVAVGDRTVTSAVLRTESGAAAASIARSVADALDPLPSSGVRVHGFAVRGGGLVMVRLSDLRPAEAGRRLVSVLGRAALEAAPAEAVALPNSPRDAARVLGVTWLAGAARNAGDEVAIGVGAVVAGGRADDPDSDDPDAPVRARAARFLSAAAEGAWSALSPELSGDVSARNASVSLVENGARIDVERRPTDGEIAIAVRFLGGGRADPPALHGRAALLAELSATGCGIRSAPALREHLRTLGATVASFVDADSHGVLVRGPRERAFALVDLAMTCGLAPSLERPDVVEARLSAVERVDPIAAVAAAALSPLSPGLVAPRGTVGTIQSVSLAALRRELVASRVGARTSVAVVGAVDVEAVLARVARRLAGLEAGAIPSLEAVAQSSSEIVSFETSEQSPRVVVSFIARGPTRPGRAAASAFGAEAANAISQTRGITVAGVRAGVGGDATWLAVALEVDESHLDTLPDRVRIAVERAKRQSLDDSMARARRETRWADAEPTVRALNITRERLVGPERESVDFTALSAPAFAIGRPR